MYCIPVTRLRRVFAFAGIRMSSASSTARQLATACTVVHTPQMRCTNAHASRGSRPCMMVSIPRNCVDVAHALAILPFSDCASMRRWPSMRVIGSTTTLVLAIVRLLRGRRFGYLVGVAAATDLRVYRGRAVRGDSGGSPDRERGADRVRALFHREPADVRQSAVERGHRLPEVRLGAAEARMPGADGPARTAVPHEDGAGREGRRPLATRPVQAPALARPVIVERLDELAGVEVRTPRALVVDALAIREQRAPLAVDRGKPSKREIVHDGRGHDVADRRTTRDRDDRRVLYDGAHAGGARRPRGGAHPAVVTIVFFLMAPRPPPAPVGCGRPACTLPQCAHAPSARI